jgi:hypothetical protein
MHPVFVSLESSPCGLYARFRIDWEIEGLSCALSLRAAGDMRFDPTSSNPNRNRLFAALGLDPEAVAARVQTHSRHVVSIDSAAGMSGALPPGDGLATRESSVVLSVTVADCLPVFLADRRTGAFALLHSGWKGTGIALEALTLMGSRWGTKPEDVAALLGPCIRGCCYEVGEERANAFEAEFGPACADSNPAVRRDGGRCYIDLQAANAALLESAGVRKIAACRECTYTDERLGSFRREGPESYTRMVALFGRLP